MAHAKSTPTAPVPETSSSLGARLLWFLPALVAFLVYLPALPNAFIWNDVDYVTRPPLRSVEGLWHIWFDVLAGRPPLTEQYYPLLHSFFWLQFQVFGDTTNPDNALGYHVVNVLLHAICASLIALAVARFGASSLDPKTTRLARRAGLIAGFLFALHPVYVESVAWISEQKNTFSLLWYLLAGLAWLRFDELRRGAPAPAANSPLTRRPGFWYAVASALFLCALFSKSLTATLAPALLVAVWWRRGRVDFRHDVLPLLPWFAAGAVLGVITGYVERTYVGAQGADFELGLVERGLLAGRVICFYIGKFLWPAELIFIYPRWTVSAAVWWQWIFPALAIGLLAVLWLRRRQARGPLAAYLYFVGSLVPTIGFFNVYAFKYSYVADHWNYLPSIGLAAALAFGLSSLWETTRAEWRLWLGSGVAAIAAVLAVLTWRESRGYRDAETFYQTILRKNPECWLALNNMGLIEINRDRPAEAVRYLEQTLRFRPNDSEPHNSLGLAYARTGRPEDALRHYQRAIQIRPHYSEAHFNLGSLFLAAGRFEDAARHLAESVRLNPAFTSALNALGISLAQLGRPEQAIPHFEAALAIRPDYPEAQANLATVLMGFARFADAARHFEAAVAARPGNADWQRRLGSAYSNLNQWPAAAAAYQRSLAAQPDSSEAHLRLAEAFRRLNRVPDAARHEAEGQRLRSLGR